MRNGEVSYWWHARGIPPRRGSLPGSTEADGCIVGAGYTGLWTAYYLSRADPGLRIVVLEASFAGYGASGRNGGWVTAELPGSRARYARHPRGQDGVRDLAQHLRDTVDEVASVCDAEGIDAGLVKGGTLSVATSAAQEARLRHRLEQERAWGDDAGIVRYLEKTELDDRLHVAGALGALYSPHCARVQPADLVAGLAETVTRAGVRLYEDTPVTSISAGRARTRAGDVAHAYMYAQRTADGRIALGGRGVPYRFGSGVDHDGAIPSSTIAQLGRILRRMFPAAAGAGLEHAWCGVLGVPRDWCATVTLDPQTGLGWAGGYTGHGVAASNLAGRTLADLIRGVPSPLTALPWVGHRSPRWEPEPARWAGVRGLYALYRTADRLESARRSPRTSVLARAGDLISGIPH